MIKNKKIEEFTFRFFFPLMAFWQYWSAFDDDYAREDILWGAIVTLAFALALYLYFPIAKKVQNGSIIWILGGFTLILLLSLALNWTGIWPRLSDVVLNVLQFPSSREAWGLYLMYFVIFTPTFHYIARQQDKPAISWFKGPARWNRSEI